MDSQIAGYLLKSMCAHMLFKSMCANMLLTACYVSIRQHTSAYVSIRQHTAQTEELARQAVARHAALRPHTLVP
jgi:hypothetical protein